jgi:hypothetical protein
VILWQQWKVQMAEKDFAVEDLKQKLTPSEQALRDLYVSEYMKDFDPFNAAIRCGFQASYASEWGKKLFQDSYVQSQIALLTRTPIEASEAESRAMFENNLLYLMYNGSTATRVSATKAYGEFKGWSKPDSGEDPEGALIDILKEFASRAPV